MLGWSICPTFILQLRAICSHFSAALHRFDGIVYSFNAFLAWAVVLGEGGGLLIAWQL